MTCYTIERMILYSQSSSPSQLKLRPAGTSLPAALFTLVCAFYMILCQPASAHVSDYNGDGRSDVAMLYDYGGATSRLWFFKSDGLNFISSQAWYSGPAGFDEKRAKIVSGNFDGDPAGLSDIAMLYDYGNSTSGLWIFQSDGTHVTPHLAWYSGGFNAISSKMVSGDFNGDGTSDVAILYDYGGGTSRIWTFISNGTTMTPSIAWYSGPGGFDENRAKIVGGDFNGDGISDVAAIYDYGGGTSRLLTFITNGSTMTAYKVWYSGSGGFDKRRAKMISGNFDGDTDDDVAILYDYGGGTSRLWFFKSDGVNLSPTMAWYSQPGGFDASRAKMTGGDYDGDPGGLSDIALIYDYGGGTSRLWFFKSNGLTFTPSQAWYSGPGGWEVIRTGMVNGWQFTPRYGLAVSKTIDINLSAQALSCYENSLCEVDENIYVWTGSAVFSTLVSSGRPPFNTPAGNFAVYWKDPSVDMSGFGGTSEYYYVPNVPYVLWFNGNYSIHGAYWHNDFGNVRSHGCVNVPVDSALWIYQWAPIGTPVHVHY